MDQFQFAERQIPRDYHSHQISFPENWHQIDSIDWQKKIIVDVGCGVGEWSLNQAKLYPDVQYIGIEKTHQRSNQLIKNKNQLGLNNYLAIQADAITLIDHVFPKLSVDEYYFFHPNPWIKKKQANKRYMVSPSFKVFDLSLKKQGLIYLVSNTEDYVVEAKYFLENFWDYQIIHYQQLDFCSNPRTPFERKYLSRKEKIFELKAIKK